MRHHRQGTCPGTYFASSTTVLTIRYGKEPRCLSVLGHLGSPQNKKNERQMTRTWDREVAKICLLDLWNAGLLQVPRSLSHTRAHTRQLRKKAHHPRRKQTRFSRTAPQAHKTTLPEENQVPECHGGLRTVQGRSRAQPMRDLVLAQYSNNLAVTRRYVKKPRSLSALDALWMSSSLYLHIVVSLTV